MTAPTQPSRWARLRGRLARAHGPRRRHGNVFVVVSIVVAAALVIVFASWVNVLALPAHREGRPTASVSPLPEPSKSATPTEEPSAKPGQDSTQRPTSKVPNLKSSGKFDQAKVNVAAAGSAGKLRRYAVLVETSAKLNADEVGEQIAGVLNDPRGWAGSGNVRFALVASQSKADFTITLASPATAKKACTLEPSSCISAGDIMIDAAEWLGGRPADYPSKSQWQAYLVNHALGHLLGEKHQECSRKGKAAPAMARQDADLAGCTANPWPFP